MEIDSATVEALTTLVGRAKLVMLILENDKKAALGKDMQDIIVRALQNMFHEIREDEIENAKQ